MPALSLFLLLAVYASAAICADAVPVRTQPLSAIALYPEHSAPATVVSESETVLSAEIAARVVAFTPRVGDVIERGGVIARLDCRDFQLELAAARAELEVLRARMALAERRLARARELESRQSLAVEILDEREAERTVLVGQIHVAEARIAKVELAVSRCVINSPFRALLRERLAPVGRYTAVGDEVAAVIDLDAVELSAEVLAVDVGVVEATAALAFVDGEKRYPVRLRAAVAAISSATRNRELRLAFVDQAPLVGTPGQLAWRDSRAHVPGQVLVRRGDDLGLFTVAGGVARFHVLAGAQQGRASAVEFALDTQVVVDGHYGLNDGDPVSTLDR